MHFLSDPRKSEASHQKRQDYYLLAKAGISMRTSASKFCQISLEWARLLEIVENYR